MKRYAEEALANPSRRLFLQVAAIAGGGSALGFGASTDRSEAAPASSAPNAFVRIGSDGIVTVVIKHFEMGQG